MRSNKQKVAFSLIELSISVIIISIIIAAITTGISLQKQAQIRTIASEFDLIQTAINNFKLQYNALPGDINNATTLWPNPIITADGNGNGRISASGTFDNGNEDVYFFQHLYLAGITPSAFIGGPLSPVRYVIGENIYPSKTSSKAGYSVFYHDAYIYWGQLIEYGSIHPNGLHTNSSVVEASTAYQLDLKIDDGFASTGKLRTKKGDDLSGTVCVDSSYNYILSNSSINCRHIFIIE